MRLRRALSTVAKVTGLLVVFVAALAAGSLVHLGLRVPHDFVRHRISEALTASFRGTIEIVRFGRVRFGSIDGIEGEARDPEGLRVINLAGGRARIDPVALLRSLFSSGALEVTIDEITVDAGEVVLDKDASGALRISRTFEPREASRRGARPVVIAIDRIELRHVWVHGQPTPTTVLDADATSVSGSFAKDGDGTVIEVRRATIRGRGLRGLEPSGTLSLQLLLPPDDAGDVVAEAGFEGALGGIEIAVDGSVSGGTVHAFIDARATPAAAHASLPSIEPRDTLHAHARIEGELPRLRIDAQAFAASGELTLEGWIDLPGGAGSDLTALADLEAKGVDLSAIHRRAPRTRASATLRADVLRSASGSLRGSFALAARPGEIEGTSIPALDLHGDFTDETIIAVGHVAEPGAPTQVSLSMHREAGGEGDVHFSVATVIPNLADVTRLPDLGRGRVELFVNGQLSLAKRTILGRVSADVEHLEGGGVRLGFARLDARAEGPLDSPSLDVSLNGAALMAYGYGFAGFRARARGTPELFDVDAQLAGDQASPSMTLAARAGITDGFVAESVRLGLRRADVEARVSAEAFRVRDGKVDIEGARVDGLGAPLSADLQFDGRQLTVRASTTRLELDRVSRLIPRGESVAGSVGFDADLTVSNDRAKGRLSLEVAELEARGYGTLTGQLEAVVDGRSARGSAEAKLGDAGRLEVTASPIRVGGNLLELSAWLGATGVLDARANVRLDRALAFVPREKRPVSSAAGRVSFQLRASRDNASELPDVDLQVLSVGLELAAKVEETRRPDGTVLAPLPAWKQRGLDGALRLDVTGKTGRTVLEARLRDERGLLASVDASADLPLRAMLERPRDALRTAENAELDVSVTVPRRSVATLTEVIDGLPLEGEIELGGTLKGTLKRPDLAVTARGYDLSLSAGKQACDHPIAARADLAYDGHEAKILLAASTHGRGVLDGNATVKLDLPAVIDRRAVPWEASGNLRLANLPLQVFQPIVRKPLRGGVSGKIDVASLGRSPTVEAVLDLDEGAIDGAPLPRGNARVSLQDGKLDASLALQQPDGWAEVRASGIVEGSGGVIPRLSRTQPISFTLMAKSFRLAVFRPLTRGTLHALDGRVDADVKATYKQAASDGKMTGSIVLRDGVFSSPQIGQRFSKIRGKITMSPWGTLNFDDFSAEAPTGRLTASAKAVLDGLALRSASAKLVIKDGESIPVTVEGVPMGRAHGTAIASAGMSPDKKRFDIKIDVPLLEVDLPKSRGGTPQPLAPDEHIRTGFRSGSTFHAVALERPQKPRERTPVDTRVAIELQLARVRKVGLVDVNVRGRIVVDTNGETRVSGRVRVLRGELELQGKRFTIDHATVSFVGDDPANPLVVATAYWDAPEGTRVFADFRGTPKDGQLTLRSDPALTEDQIIALLMFGSPDGALGTGQQADQLAQGVTAAGGIVTRGLNEIIADTTTADITTRVDTSDAANPKPEVAIQITSRVTARFGVKVGTPGPGDNPDRSSITLDWRFVRRWAVSAELGDQGSTAVDVVWRLRF